MPYIDTVNDVWHVTTACEYPGPKQFQEAGWNLMITTSGGSDSRLALAGQVDSLIAAHITPSLAADAHPYGTRVARVYPTSPFTPAVTRLVATGGAGGLSMPTQVRTVTTLYTAMAGRKYHGRVYGFTPEASRMATDGSVENTYASKWNTVLDTFRAGLTVMGTTWQLVINHLWDGPPTPYVPPDLVTRVFTQPKWGTQRRGGWYGRPNGPPW